MPRPTRTRPCRAPLLSLSSLSFMVLHSLSLLSRMPRQGQWIGSGWLVDAHQMLHFLDLATHYRRVLDLDRAPHLVQAQADKRRALGLVAADRRSGLRNLDLRHRSYSTTASA